MAIKPARRSAHTDNKSNVLCKATEIIGLHIRECVSLALMHRYIVRAMNLSDCAPETPATFNHTDGEIGSAILILIDSDEL